MKNSLDDFIWHDGNILSLSYSVSKDSASIKIEAEFYSTPTAKNRDRYTIDCDGVTRFNSLVDFVEVLDNFSAGSIANGYFKQGTLRLYLIDGVVEISANSFELTKH